MDEAVDHAAVEGDDIRRFGGAGQDPFAERLDIFRDAGAGAHEALDAGRQFTVFLELGQRGVEGFQRLVRRFLGSNHPVAMGGPVFRRGQQPDRRAAFN